MNFRPRETRQSLANDDFGGRHRDLGTACHVRNRRFNPWPRHLPGRNGQMLRDYLRTAEDAGADFILVPRWNEWPETTVVEPAATWPDP